MSHVETVYITLLFTDRQEEKEREEKKRTAIIVGVKGNFTNSTSDLEITWQLIMFNISLILEFLPYLIQNIYKSSSCTTSPTSIPSGVLLLPSGYHLLVTWDFRTQVRICTGY